MRVLTAEEAWQRFDNQARYDLGMSGEEFLAAWDRGELRDPDLHSKVVRVWMLRTDKP
jgi:hypothetical protein